MKEDSCRESGFEKNLLVVVKRSHMQREIKSATEKGRERMARCEKACERGVFGKNNKLTYFFIKTSHFSF